MYTAPDPFLFEPPDIFVTKIRCFSNEREKGKIKEMLVISPRSFHYESVCTYEPDSRFILFCKRLIDQHAEVRKPHVSDSYYILKEVVS